MLGFKNNPYELQELRVDFIPKSRVMIKEVIHVKPSKIYLDVNP